MRTSRLRLRAQHITTIGSAFAWAVPEAAVNSDGLAPLDVLRAMNRRDM